VRIYAAQVGRGGKIDYGAPGRDPGEQGLLCCLGCGGCFDLAAMSLDRVVGSRWEGPGWRCCECVEWDE
jgi:hypothetical protein